jgi:ABC-type lipoprotein release transport system permease subunit
MRHRHLARLLGGFTEFKALRRVTRSGRDIHETLRGFQLPEVRSLELAAILAAAAVLMTIALAACYWPARRAAKFHPLAALRMD